MKLWRMLHFLQLYSVLVCWMRYMHFDEDRRVSVIEVDSHLHGSRSCKLAVGLVFLMCLVDHHTSL